MSDTVQQFEQPDDTQTVASAGRMLAAARENAGLSVDEVAARLRLGVRQVQALEADDASALPGAMFVRGFIRNYAKLLGMDAEALLEAHRVSAPDTGSHVISLQSENIPIINRDKKVWLPYVVASVLVAIALGGWMVYMEYAVQGSHKAVEEKNVAERPVAPVAVAPAPVAAEPVAPSAPVKPVTLPEPVATSVAQEVKPAEPVTAPTSSAAARIVMNFTAQTWVSVTDRDGKEIFNKTPSAGSQETLEGLPPFKIVIGNAGGVRLTYNDKPVDLAPYAKTNVARLTLE